jgi:hypothetical protein
VAAPRPEDIVPLEDKRAISGAWLERTVQMYPEQTAPVLLGREDRFRNPVGFALREGLPVLLDAVLGEAELDAARKALDGLLSILAVQEFSASQAVSFVFLLKPLLRERSGRDERLERRVDELALMAFDAYTQCRERLLTLRVNEARRRTFLLERMLKS